MKAEAETEVPMADEIVSMGKSMGLEVNNADMEELAKDHQQLTTKKLMELQSGQVKAIQEELSSEEEDRNEITSAQIKAICSKWRSEELEFTEKHYPGKDVANRAIKILNDSAMLLYRIILQQRKK